MDSKGSLAEEQKRKGAGRELLLSVGGLVAFVLIGLGVIAASDPGGSGLSLFSKAPKAQSALELTLLHTNDTWGYIETCGG